MRANLIWSMCSLWREVRCRYVFDFNIPCSDTKWLSSISLHTPRTSALMKSHMVYMVLFSKPSVFASVYLAQSLAAHSRILSKTCSKVLSVWSPASDSSTNPLILVLSTLTSARRVSESSTSKFRLVLLADKQSLQGIMSMLKCKRAEFLFFKS